MFLESQDHWSPIPQLGTLGHVHVGTCFPLGQTVSGSLHFDIRVVMFENKGTLIRVKMQDDKSKEHVLLKPNLTPPDGGERVFWFAVDVNTKLMPDGLRQFRWYADVEHANGNTQTARSSWPLDVENGTADSNVTGGGAYVRYMNWYQVASPARNWGYIGPVVKAVPLAPVSGPLSLDVSCAVNGDSSSPPVSRATLNLDAKFHQGDEGIVLHDGGPFGGVVTIDTASLSEGPHRLSFRCIQLDGAERHEGIGVVPFTVDR